MSDRPSVHETLMRTADAWSERGTCSRLRVGAVIASPDGVILSSGYNGAPMGLPHCEHPCTCRGAFFPEVGCHEPPCQSLQPCVTAVHAEANAVVRAARQGTSVFGAIMVTTHATCRACAMLIIQSGIREMYYRTRYRDNGGLDMLSDAGVIVKQMGG